MRKNLRLSPKKASVKKNTPKKRYTKNKKNMGLFTSFKGKLQAVGGLSASEIMFSEIKKRGGEIHFNVEISENGWIAECQEFPEIITWGDSKNPSHEELRVSSMEALKAAFNVPSINHNYQVVRKENHKPIRVSLQTDFCFA